MRIRIHHATRYVYEHTARSIVQVLRVTPKSHDGQQVVSWRLDADADVRLRHTEDAFGNVVHCLSTERPTQALTVTVTGEIVTRDTNGMVQGTLERLPTAVYLRRTALTEPDPAIAAFAADSDPGEAAGPLARAHALSTAVADAIAYDVHATDSKVTAAEAFALRRGVCQDLAHVFIAAARARGLPARYVSGHLLRADGEQEQEASHAWAEACIDGLGWVGFDPANRVCPTDAYVRVAIGLDYLDAAPVRGARNGGGGESLSVKLSVAPSGWQSQSQSQSGGGAQSQRQSQA